MKHFVSLNQLPLDAQKVLSLIGEMIDETNGLGENRVLVLEVREIGQEAIMLPLLEYQNEHQG